MDYLDMFQKGKLRIHIRKDQQRLLKELQNLMPKARWRSGSPLAGSLSDGILSRNYQIWIVNHPDEADYSITWSSGIITSIKNIEIYDFLSCVDKKMFKIEDYDIMELLK